jgi:hypothetical protein
MSIIVNSNTGRNIITVSTNAVNSISLLSQPLTIVDHNNLSNLQGGVNNQFYHLSSGHYFNLTTGDVVRPSETGQFYSSNNPSGYAATGYVTGISGGLQTQISTLNNATGNYALKSETGNFITNSQTGQFYANSNPSGFITGVDLSSYATQTYVTGISGELQTQINSLVENSNTIIGLSIFL